MKKNVAVFTLFSCAVCCALLLVRQSDKQRNLRDALMVTDALAFELKSLGASNVVIRFEIDGRVGEADLPLRSNSEATWIFHRTNCVNTEMPFRVFGKP